MRSPMKHLRRLIRRHALRLRGTLAMRRYVRAVEAIQGGFTRPDMDKAEYIAPSIRLHREAAAKLAAEWRAE